MINVIMPKAIMPNVIMPNVITLTVIMLSVIMLNVIMVSVVAPFIGVKSRFKEVAFRTLFLVWLRPEGLQRDHVPGEEVRPLPVLRFNGLVRGHLCQPYHGRI